MSMSNLAAALHEGAHGVPLKGCPLCPDASGQDVLGLVG